MLPCGCVPSLVYADDDLPFAVRDAMQWCPLHAAAREMLTLLEAGIADIDAMLRELRRAQDLVARLRPHAGLMEENR